MWGLSTDADKKVGTEAPKGEESAAEKRRKRLEAWKVLATGSSRAVLQTPGNRVDRGGG